VYEYVAFEVWGLELGVGVRGFGMWGSRFGVWDPGFGVGGVGV
jgi:hypothetical protein